MFNHVRFVFVCLIGVFVANLIFCTNVVEGARYSRRNRSRDNFVKKAKIKVESGNYLGAKKDMEAALILDPKNEDNLYFTALIYYKVGKSASAIMQCNKILKNNRARKYRTRALKLKRLAQDNRGTGSKIGRMLRGSSTTMLYSTAMSNQKEFVDSGYSNVVRRVQQARRRSLSPVRHRTVAKSSAYDVLTGKEALATPVSTYAKATTVDSTFTSSTLDKIIDNATPETSPDNASTVDFRDPMEAEDNDEITFTDFDIDGADDSAAMADHMKPVGVEKTTKPALEASDDGNDDSGFGDFSDDDDDDDKPAKAPVKTPEKAPAKVAANNDSDDDDSGFGDFGDDSDEEEPAKAAANDDSDDDSGFGDFGDDSDEEEPVKTPAKPTKAPKKAPPEKEVKEDEDSNLDAFGGFGDESSEEKEEAESKDDASDGFGDFGDDSDDDSGEDADDFGGFDGF